MRRTTAGSASAVRGGGTGTGGFLQRYSERHKLSAKLAKALESLEKGDSQTAAKELSAICSGSPLPGVTDEALFRLALLTLKPAAELPTSRQSRLLLQRLKREFPDSPWNAQAAHLMELITITDGLKHQNKILKTSNQSLNSANQALSREIRELNSNLEQLKHLDLELEKKTR